MPGDEEWIQLEEERDSARCLELDARVARREVERSEECERHLHGMTCLPTASSKFNGKGKGEGKGKGKWNGDKATTGKGKGGGESSAEGRGPSSAGPQPAHPELTPTFEVMALIKCHSRDA